MRSASILDDLGSVPWTPDLTSSWMSSRSWTRDLDPMDLDLSSYDLVKGSHFIAGTLLF